MQNYTSFYNVGKGELLVRLISLSVELLANAGASNPEPYHPGRPLLLS